MSPIQEILDFWFLPSDHEDYGKKREEWFQKNSDFDEEIRRRFLEHYEQATTGYFLDHKDLGTTPNIDPPSILKLLI